MNHSYSPGCFCQNCINYELDLKERIKEDRDMPVVEITTFPQLKDLKSVIYSAIFLTPGSQHQLLSWFEKLGYTLLPEVKAHHVTLEFKPKSISNLPVGLFVDLQVNRIYVTDKCQAVSVKIVTPVTIPLPPKPHITISHSSDVAPKFSQEIIEGSGIVPVESPTLTGIIGVFGKV